MSEYTHHLESLVRIFLNHETPDDAVDPAIGYAVVGRLQGGGFVPVTYPERVRGVIFAELWIFGEPSSVRDMELEKNLEPCLASMTQTSVHRIMPGVRHCDYVGINSLMPVEWNDWFWATIAEDCPFEIDGQHDHSLVEAYRIKDHCEDLLRDAIDGGKVTREEADQFLEKLHALGETLVDLES